MSDRPKQTQTGNESENFLFEYRPKIKKDIYLETKASKRKKNFLSHSRERLDNFVGKFSGSKKTLLDDEAEPDYRQIQQKKRKEGTLSPRSNEFSYMIKECVKRKLSQE